MKPKKFMGLRKDEIQMLELANKKIRKHPRIYTKITMCANHECGFRALYAFLRCPECDMVRE